MAESRRSKGRRRATAALVRLGEEIRLARMSAGLTLRQVGRSLGISTSELSRIETGQARWVSLVRLTEVCSIVGLDLSSRAYPGGEPLRDVAHLALLTGFRSLVGPGIRVRTEVPIEDGRDLRAWDVLLACQGGATCGVELETRLLDAQALTRRLALKRRDGQQEVVLLVLSDTRTNRAAVRAADALLRGDFPLDDAAIRAFLAAGRIPPAGGILFVSVPAALVPRSSRPSSGSLVPARPSSRSRPAGRGDIPG